MSDTAAPAPSTPTPAAPAPSGPSGPQADPHILGSYDPSRRWLGLATLTFSLLAITTDMTILNVAIPQMAADLQPTASQQLWIIDAYSLVMAGLLISMSSIADRWGRKRMLMLGYVLIALASVLVLFAHSPGFVIALRVLLGVGAAMVMPSTLSLLRVTFTDTRERATALAVWAAVAGIGAAVGPLLGGFLLETFDWRAAFLVSVPMMAIAFVSAIFTIPESRVPEPGPWDPFGALLTLLGMTTSMWAIKQFSEEGSLTYLPAWIAFGIGVTAIVVFVRRCLNSDAPLLDVTMFRHRIFSAGVLAALIASFSMSAGLLLLAQWLQLVNGASAFESGLQLMPLALAAAVTSLLAPVLSERIGMRATIFLALFIAGAGMMVLGVRGENLELTSVFISLALIGAGIGALALASSMIMGGVPRSKAGNAAAMEDTAYEFGAVLGIAILGSLASFLYRREIGIPPETLAMGADATDAVRDSLGGAVAVAEAAHLPDLAARAGDAFTSGMGLTGLIGGLVLLAFAFVVFFLTPKGTMLGDLEH